MVESFNPLFSLCQIVILYNMTFQLIPVSFFMLNPKINVPKPKNSWKHLFLECFDAIDSIIEENQLRFQKPITFQNIILFLSC